MGEKVSIIVPVYKVDKYLRECINTLLNQSYTNLEIILIDDESPDQCPVICDEFAAKDMRISVVHQQNGGAGNARNTGLNKATGKYVCFVDSDDLVHRNYVSELVHTLEQEKADIAVCSYYYLYKNRREKHGYNGSRQVLSQKDYLLCFLNDWTCSLIWNKIFRREVIGTVRFVEGHKIDDEFFTYQVVMNSKKVVLFDNPLYEYRMRASSVMNLSEQYEELILKDKLEYIVERYSNVSSRFPEIRTPYLADLVNNVILLWRSGKNYPQFKKLVRGQIKRYQGEILFSKIGLKMKYSFLKSIYFERKRYVKTLVPDNTSSEALFE